LAESWGEARSLLTVIQGAADPAETMLRLRGVLRRLVQSIQLLVLSRGRERCCFADVRFHGGAQRSFIIWFKPPYGNQHGRQAGYVWATSGVLSERAYMDLSDPAEQLRAADFVAAWPGIDVDEEDQVGPGWFFMKLE
jgi:hypothetical protein